MMAGGPRLNQVPSDPWPQIAHGYMLLIVLRIKDFLFVA
jgi:hypothetical protein